MFQHLLRGAAAGAAGTTALNATTYLDMAITARPASSTPQQAVDELAKLSGHPIPGQGEQHDNRLQGIGPLAGLAVGVGVGAAAGVAWPVLRRLPFGLAGALLGGVVMVASGGPVTALGITDPRTWSARDWLSDIVPHVVYGAACVGVLRLLDKRR